MNPTISVIIIVKNDRGIAETLAALTAMEKPAPTEIIVVDASAPETLADIRARYERDVRWLAFTPAVAGKSSIPEQRNHGIRESRGEIIAFIDASCVPAPQWLTAITRPLLDGSESLVAGSVQASDPRTQINYHTSDNGTGYVGAAASQNLAFKKDVWRKVGGFDETFLYSSDTDFTWRCTDAGYKIRYCPEASMTHDWGTGREALKRAFNYGKGRAKLLVKHPHRRSVLWGENLYVSFYTLFILGLPLTYWIPWYPLAILAILVKNARNHPFQTLALNLTYTLGFYRQLWRELV